MKAHREHIQPFHQAAIAALNRAVDLRKNDAGTAIVFPGAAGRALSDMTLSKVLSDAHRPFTAPSFRSSFKNWASEQTTFSDAVSEAELPHGDPDKVRKAYWRTFFLHLRRDLMNAWARFIAEPSDNIVSFPSRTAGSGGA